MNGVVVKYSEPEDAHKPTRRWRLYPFKGDQALEAIPLHRQSSYLVGRDRLIADIPTDHPSCSKQHAVIQFRAVRSQDELLPKDGSLPPLRVKPYVIDLQSTNGTYVNGERIDDSRYVELKEQDLIKFGFSTRDYVLLVEDLVS